MGFNFSWIAVRGRQPAEVVRELGLEPSGNTLDCRDDDAAGLVLPGGWFLVELKRWEMLDESVACRISLNAEAIVASVFENPMNSMASSFVDGVRMWQVFHDGSDGPTDDLEPEGTPPAEFAVLHEQAQNDQAGVADVDYYFDVPLELAEGIVGYKHDTFAAEELGDEPYEELVPAGTTPKDQAVVALRSATQRWESSRAHRP